MIVKEKIKVKLSELGDADPTDPERQKLVHTGRILSNNAAVISELGLKDGDFLVLMRTPAPAKKPVAPSQPAVVTSQTSASSRPAAPSASASPQTGSGDIVMGAAFESAVNALVDMGFVRSDVIAALRAAFNNPDRAVEYLTNGIPENIQREIAQAQAQAQAPVARQASSDRPVQPTAQAMEAAAAMSDEERLATLNALRNDPMLQQIRAAMRQNPELLEPLLEQIGQMNPELYRHIQENLPQFAALLRDETDFDGDDNSEDEEHGETSGEEMGEASGTHTIELTEEESAAVERVQKKLY